MRAWPGILLVSGLAVLAAGCGGGSKSPSVASLGPTTTSTTTTTSDQGLGSPSGQKGATGSFIAFVNCMQKHGIQAQIGQGGHGVTINGAGPNTPGLQAAQAACRKLLPGGGPPQLTPAQQAENTKKLLVMAKCMRAHGMPNFPDPNSQGVFQFGPGNGNVDPNSSQFQSAMQACRGKGAVVRIAVRAPGGGGAEATAKG
jgi:hypothetical protein